jgi:membrane-associated phospholipid phosphatase
MAQGLGVEIPYIYRIGVGTVLTLPIEGNVIFLYEHIRPNDVAAMPSLHAALPLLLALILWRLKRPLAWAGFAYTAVLGFFLVYFGEHYVIDLVAGWALAGLVYWLVWATPAWLRRWLPASTVARRRALAIPATALTALLLVVGTAAVSARSRARSRRRRRRRWRRPWSTSKRPGRVAARAPSPVWPMPCWRPSPAGMRRT